MAKKQLRYRYKNLSILALSLILAVFLYHFELFHKALLSIGSWGYLGAFLAGILSVSSFTVATGVVILLVLAEKLSLLEIALMAGLGALLGDIVIFRFVKDGLTNEVKSVFARFGGKHLLALLHTPYFSWTLPIIGAIIIASPLPDELGVSLLGIARMNMYSFMILSFLLNSIGIFLVISASLVLKP